MSKEKRKSHHDSFSLTDWRGHSYEFEIAYVSFLHGFVVWWDDEPWDDHVFTSRHAALASLKAHLAGPF
jgi:hypothetical protein